jgi:hypothetical protein
MFFPALGIFAAAAGLIQLGALTVKIALLKAMLAVTAVCALLLGLGHVWRWRKDTSPKE